MLKTFIKAREAVIRVVRNEEGASLAEYALIIALVLVGAGIVLGVLTNTVTSALDAGEKVLNNATP